MQSDESVFKIREPDVKSAIGVLNLVKPDEVIVVSVTVDTQIELSYLHILILYGSLCNCWEIFFIIEIMERYTSLYNLLIKLRMLQEFSGQSIIFTFIRTLSTSENLYRKTDSKITVSEIFDKSITDQVNKS